MRHMALILALVFTASIYAGDAVKPLEIQIKAKRFSFTPNEITVQKGQPVRLLITALDVSHGFAIDAFKIKKKIDVEAEEPTVVEFTPDKEGVYDFYCVVFCGSGHEGMRGKLIVK